MANILEVKDIVCMPAAGYRILNGISFEAEPGESIRILGRTGSGKTLLTKVLIGERMPEDGEVCFWGKSYRDMPEKDRRQIRRTSFAVLGRTPGFFSDLSMQENVSLPLLLMGEGRNAQKQALEVMEIFDAEKTAIRKPNRLTIDESCRLQLARAYLMKPQIIIADDFTAGLSCEKEKKLWDYLKILQEKNKSTLIHFTDCIGGCGEVNHTFTLDGGQLLPVTKQGNIEGET